ncbi:PP2C family protein-serine/threonine phosphatase [Streptomyces ovatisporus]|uniref:PP2C family protein-serine/threonine phosphatase n=1 Tax=Streptomyces ovatisporus TaxID=1128682 RepID=A0ABV9A7W2_9ACTN
MGTGSVIAEHEDGTRRAPHRGRTALLPRWVRLLPPALLLMALVMELSAPPRYSFASLLTAAVVLAALLSRFLVTIVLGALAVVLLVSMHLLVDDVYPDDITGPVITLVLVTGFATTLALVLERTTLQLVQVQAVAEATQRALLRPLPDRLGPVRLAGVYRAADEAALIGGDFYSARQTPHGVRVIVGDVRGKGIGATESVATITSAFREAAMSSPSLRDVADRIEAAMAMDRVDMEAGGSLAGNGPGRAPSGLAGELFATAVLLEFAPGGGFLRVLDRGHPSLYLIGAGGGVTRLDPGPEYALPLGFGDLAPGTDAGIKEYRLADGDTLVAYSDGVTEARSRSGGFYPLEQRLAERYGSTAGAPAQAAAVEPAEVVAFVNRDVTRWAEAVNDDMVIVVLQHSPP